MTKSTATALNLYTTKGVVVLDSEGKRVFAKYYTNDYPTLKEQKSFEKILFTKTKKANTDILMLDGQVVVYIHRIDVFIYLFGSVDDNELMLNYILKTFYETLVILLPDVEKRIILENFDLVALALDETIDGGILLDGDPPHIASRVTKKSNESDSPFEAQQLVSQFLQSQIARSLLK